MEKSAGTRVVALLKLLELRKKVIGTLYNLLDGTSFQLKGEDGKHTLAS